MQTDRILKVRVLAQGFIVGQFVMDGLTAVFQVLRQRCFLVWKVLKRLFISVWVVGGDYLRCDLEIL